VSLAAMHAKAKWGLKRIAIIDWDVRGSSRFSASACH
jgi:hypothetical protein